MTGLRPLLRVVSALAVFGMLFAPAHAAAQVAVGTLLGNVTDESGAAIPGATITATEVRTNISRTTVSNQAGAYTFTNTSPGTYRVEGELIGFKKFTRENVEVSVNTTIRVEISLAVGTLEESVIVTGEAPMLQTDRTDTGRIIESAQITQMPLGFNRNFQALLITVPGASRPFRPHSEFYNSQDSLSSNINGQGRQSNNVQLEGADNSDNGGNLAFMIPSAEAIETVAVTTSNYDAEFGRAGGAVTNVTLKTGTNQLRGSVFSFGNTEAPRRATRFRSWRWQRPSPCSSGLRRAARSCGTNCSSSANYVRTNDDSGRLTRGHVRKPSFRNATSARHRRASTTRHWQCRWHWTHAFANNQIPLSRMSPIARELISHIPLPNIPGAAVGATNFELPFVREKRTNQGDVKVTWQAAANDLVNVRYSKQSASTLDPATFGIYGGLKPFAGTGTNPTESVGVTYNRVWSATLVRRSASAVRTTTTRRSPRDYGTTTSQDLGIKGINLNAFTSGITTINVGGYNDYLIGFGRRCRGIVEESTTTISPTATKIWNNHNREIGGDLRMNRHLLIRWRIRARRAVGAADGALDRQRGVNGFAELASRRSCSTCRRLSSADW